MRGAVHLIGRSLSGVLRYRGNGNNIAVYPEGICHPDKAKRRKDPAQGLYKRLSEILHCVQDDRVL